MNLIGNITVEMSYFYIACFATLLFIVKLALYSFTGGDTDINDANGGVETDVAFNFFSIQSVLAFLMGFGWLGLAGIKQWHMSTLNSALVAAICGFLMMILSAYLMFCLKKLGKTVTRDYSECVGKMAKAYTSFAPNGSGQVEIDFNGQLSIENAINTTDREIKSFSEVKVVKFEDNKLFIE